MAQYVLAEVYPGPKAAGLVAIIRFPVPHAL
jgi:hypothetical protein